jgi:hypothetical protein
VALGRDNVVHLALGNAPAADRIMGVLRRLIHFRGSDFPALEAEPDAALPLQDPAGDEINV